MATNLDLIKSYIHQAKSYWRVNNLSHDRDTLYSFSTPLVYRYSNTYFVWDTEHSTQTTKQHRTEFLRTANYPDHISVGKAAPEHSLNISHYKHIISKVLPELYKSRAENTFEWRYRTLTAIQQHAERYCQIFELPPFPPLEINLPKNLAVNVVKWRLAA